MGRKVGESVKRVPGELGAPVYIRVFMVDEEPLPVTEMARPWREGHEGHVAKCGGRLCFFVKT